MKAVLLSALTLVSLNSFASGLVGELPKVQFGSVFVPVDEVCVDGDMINTQQPVAVCTEWKGNEANLCSKEEEKILSTSIEYRKAIPVGEAGWETVTMTIPLEYNIPYGHYSEAGPQVVTTKHFSIPACE